MQTDIQYLEFTHNRQTVRIPHSEIISILSDDHRTVVTDNKGCHYDPLISFSKLTADLENESRFRQINRGILVNMDYISGFDSNLCILSNGPEASCIYTQTFQDPSAMGGLYVCLPSVTRWQKGDFIHDFTVFFL